MHLSWTRMELIGLGLLCRLGLGSYHKERSLNATRIPKSNSTIILGEKYGMVLAP